MVTRKSFGNLAHFKWNDPIRNLEKDDLPRLIMTSCTAHSSALSISSIIFARWQHVTELVLGSFGTPIIGEGKVIGVSNGTIQRVILVSYTLSSPL